MARPQPDADQLLVFEDPEDPQRLLWLAETDRQNSISSSKPPAGFWKLLKSNPSWAQPPFHENIRLDYEPRCLAVSKQGKSVAVGTKAGTIRILCRSKGGKWEPRPSPEGERFRAFTQKDESKREAIRAIGFLDDSTVVAGSQAGTFTVLKINGGQDPLEVIPEESARGSEKSDWFGRFTRLIYIAPPPASEWACSLFFEGPLMLGLTESSEVHLLLSQEGEYVARSGTLTELFPGLELENWSDDSRLVDGVWRHENLWLLSSDRLIYRVIWDSERREPAPECIPLKCTGALGVNFPHTMFEPRRLVGSDDGLAVLVSNYVTFLPFRDPKKDHRQGKGRTSSSRGRQARRGVFLDTESPRWINIDQATDLAVWRPYLPDKEMTGILADYRAPEGFDEAIWLVAGTAEPGLRWIRWPRDKEKEPEVKPANLSGVGERSVLNIGLGHRGSHGPSVVAGATRDCRLFLTSLLDEYQAVFVLDKLMPSLLWGDGNGQSTDADSSDDPWEALERRALQTPGLTLQTPGVALWLLRKKLRHDLEPKGNDGERTVRLPVSWQNAKRRPPLEMLDVADLRRLARNLDDYWRRSGIRNKERRSEIFKGWVLVLLERAWQLDPKVPAQLAKQIYDDIAGWHGLRDDSEIWKRLGPLAGFLRKWIIQERTYHGRSLLGPAYRNWECHYDLDALVYLTKLIRRRFDMRWEAPGTHGNPSAWSTWDLIADPQGIFSIQSYADGSLSAVSAKGKALKWRIQDPENPQNPEKAGCIDLHELESKYLRLDHGDLSLSHSLAPKFLKEYRHGPYARRLFLAEAGGHRSGEKHVLLFCFRGWRPEDRATSNDEEYSSGLSEDPEKRPLLCALLLQHDQLNSQIKIVGCSTRPLGDELYGFCQPNESVDKIGKGHYRHNLIAGTRGDWKDSETVGREENEAPFVEIQVDISDTDIALNLHLPRYEPFRKGQRSSFRKGEKLAEPKHNPCWTLVSANLNTNLWLCAGFADQRIRFYKKEEDGKWVEGGYTEQLAATDRSIPVTSSVWNLLYIEDLQLLAYGTADGVVGLLSLKQLEPEETEPREEPEPWIHLLHSRERAPVSSLAYFKDPDDKKTRLLTLSQDGYATIYHLEEARESKSTENKPRRFAFTGLWQDRFRLQESARAATLVKEKDEGVNKLYRELFPEFRESAAALAALLVGTDDGRVCKTILTLPRGTQRRRTVVSDWCEKLLERERDRERRRSDTTPTLAYCIGDREGDSYAWLRVLDIDGPEMVRYSYWHRLQAANEDITKLCRGPEIPELAAATDSYLELLDGLAHQADLRRPSASGRDPAKVIWEEASKAANQIAVEALKSSDSGRAAALVEVYNEINVKVDDLCNRWIGAEQSLEARVLIHSFNVLFDWSDIVLIAWRTPPENAARSRQFLLDSVISRRLNYNERIVRLETLRVLNTAMRRAIVNSKSDELQAVRLDLRPAKEHAEGVPVGLYDLVVLVGDLAQRYRYSLPNSDPLTTEIARFFSLSLLLLPDRALVISQIISESLLVENETLFRMILGQTSELARRLDLQEDDKVKRGLERFKAYSSPCLDFRPAEGVGRHDDGFDPPGQENQTKKSREDKPDEDELRRIEWWKTMTEGPCEKASGAYDLRDEQVKYEQRLALYAARWLATLDPREPSELEKESPYWQANQWLNGPTSPGFMSHSRTYLGELREARNDIVKAFQTDERTPGAEVDRWAPKDGLSSVEERSSAEEPSAEEPSAEERSSAEGRSSAKGQPSVDDKDEQQVSPIKNASLICEYELERLAEADIFEPQRSQYRQIMIAWRQQIERRAQRAVEVLETIDKFNRHVYRASADNFMNHITELAMQIVPVTYERKSYEADSESLGQRIEKELAGHDLVQAIFKEGVRLVDHTHLAGTLLAVVRDELRDPGRRRAKRKKPAYFEIRLKDIKEEIVHAAKDRGLKPELAWTTANHPAPGNSALWQTVIREWVKNVEDHGQGPDPDDREVHATHFSDRDPESGDRRWTLLISGNYPFKECLKRGHYRTELKRHEANAASQAKKLRNWAAMTMQPRRRLGASVAPSGGMGMYLIDKICEFSGLEAHVRIFDANEDESERDQRHRPSHQLVLRSPLCLEISWPVESQEE